MTTAWPALTFVGEAFEENDFNAPVNVFPSKERYAPTIKDRLPPSTGVSGDGAGPTPRSRVNKFAISPT